MITGRGRRGDRFALLAVILAGIGVTLWLWTTPNTAAQVGPRLTTVLAAPDPTRSFSPTRSISPTAAFATRPSGRRTTTQSPAADPTRTTVPTASSPSAAASTAASSAATASARRELGAAPKPAAVVETVTDPGPTRPRAIPAVITVPFGSSNHRNGATMTVMPHGPAASGEMWIPGPPEGIDDWATAVSWLDTEGYAAPFSTHGAVIIAGHINWHGTAGALSDLSEYGENDIGKTLTVTMTDGRFRTYRIIQGFAIDKAQLAAESNQGPLHTIMFGQTGSYGPPGHPTEELRLISCGGQYNAATSSYNSNIIIIARPVS